MCVAGERAAQSQRRCLQREAAVSGSAVGWRIAARRRAAGQRRRRARRYLEYELSGEVQAIGSVDKLQLTTLGVVKKNDHVTTNVVMPISALLTYWLSTTYWSPGLKSSLSNDLDSARTAFASAPSWIRSTLLVLIISSYRQANCSCSHRRIALRVGARSILSPA